ncbi:MAG TPA: glutamate-cysteine ligase family protein [Longimicrobiales bacterium]|nr:glutamate-cysteine ligase family protein [Longimicrobiales bacterium]
MTPTPLERIVRDQFRASDPDLDLRVGVEIEFLCFDRETRRPAPPIEAAGPDGSVPGTVSVVAELAARRGWLRAEGPGLPRFVRSDGTVVSWEPGGQIEIATPPMPSLDDVDAMITGTVGEVTVALEEHGIGLLARGLDPWTPVDVPQLWLDHPRYRRMSAHYDRGGPEGRRMMRQSAAAHVNLDFGRDPIARWNRANLLLPAAIAIFANSPTVEGRPGWRSERARAWRTLDPSRTGAFPPAPDPPAEYLEFARRASAFLLGEEGGPAVPWRETGCDDEAAWRSHLSTLFPEVRPRTYLEVRCVDSLPPHHVTLAAAFLAGAVYGSAEPPTDLPPTKERLRTAGRDGLGDPAMREEAMGWWAVARAGLVELGADFASATILEKLDDFVSTFTRTGRDPGSAPEEWVIPQRSATSALP